MAGNCISSNHILSRQETWVKQYNIPPHKATKNIATTKNKALTDIKFLMRRANKVVMELKIKTNTDTATTFQTL